MRIKNILYEDFTNYKKCSMFIGTAYCDWKCCKECGENLCQNLPLAQAPAIIANNNKIVDKYLLNEMTSAIVFGGLEPLDQFEELCELIELFRQYTQDDIVIYTGYTEQESQNKTKKIAEIGPNIIIKYGRFIPHQEKHFDEVLGVYLASDNQYAVRIS